MFKNGFPKRNWTDAEKWILGIVGALLVFGIQDLISNGFESESDCHLPWEQQEDVEKCYEQQK